MDELKNKCSRSKSLFSYRTYKAASSLKFYFLRKLPHVTILLVCTYKKNDDVLVKIPIFLTLVRQSCPSSTILDAMNHAT
jgi:hypothetical protein